MEPVMWIISIFGFSCIVVIGILVIVVQWETKKSAKTSEAIELEALRGHFEDEREKKNNVGNVRQLRQ